ncbi:MAG TPA: glycine--tRNA ligase, partial [Lapillicoccus sp.]|uniref:glycine--tRNA ligase n=1 Tax=Lapillicoccus sp. TaxID=1909287 RepID=UPI002F95AA80
MASLTTPGTTVDTVVSLCKRRGFVYPSGEIYGGTRSAWDYGPLGVELKDNIKRQWWKAMVIQRDDVVGLDSAIILPRETWVASGHVATFSDPLVECLSCHKRFRADHLQEAVAEKRAKSGDEVDPDTIPLTEIACTNCGTRGQWTEPRQFSGLLKTFLGVVEDESGLHYLRPETAQGIFLNFLNVMNSSRRKPPFGIAQIGKSFRNEITPGNFIFRTREFEQREMEFFVAPAEAPRWFEHWLHERERWYTELGIRPDHLRLRAHEADELSHYSSNTSDVEYLFPIGWSELEGIADRGDFDLSRHAEHAREKLEYVDTATRERYVPHVIEPAAGADRATLAFLVDAYDEEQVEGETRTLLRLHPKLAPVKVAVMPLVKKDGQPEVAREVYADLRRRMQAEYDEGGSIGKRYRRQDEIGTPWGVTVDHQTLEDQTVTLRDRDSLEQVRIPIAELGDEL